uniref:Putative secreted protein n=1 Tax=Anopheles darlingi TaxID=43151 RepID=A0A2M4D929_ANODA
MHTTAGAQHRRRLLCFVFLPFARAYNTSLQQRARELRFPGIPYLRSCRGPELCGQRVINGQQATAPAVAWALCIS